MRWVRQAGRLCAAWAALSVAAAASPSLEPIASRQSTFAIPFHIARVDDPAHEPVEVRLYLSTDFGATWQLYDTVDPAERRFLFRGYGDGQYWFLVRTLNRAGELHPRGGDQPELRVVVDTTPPRLYLDAYHGPAGEIVVDWEVIEVNPNPESLRIHYRTGPTETWEPVAINHRHQTIRDAVQSGRVTWWPPPDAQRVEIRGEVADMAGNPAVTHAQVWRDPPRDERNPTLGTSEAALERTSSNAAADYPFADRIVPGDVQRLRRSAAPEPDQGSDQPSDDAAEPTARREAYAGLPLGASLQMVHSRRFALDYLVDPAGHSDRAWVELWGTRNGGQNWARLRVNEDLSGPLRVEVTEDGLYGFRVVVRQGDARDDPLPQPGELPEVWIGVDTRRDASSPAPSQRQARIRSVHPIN